MAKDNNKLDELSARLDQLLSMHNSVSNEIDQLRSEINSLRIQQPDELPSMEAEDQTSIESLDSAGLTSPKPESTQSSDKQPLGEQDTDYFKQRERRIIGKKQKVSSKKKIDFEKLIGENLINKIGILVLIIGVAIGAKYSIENDLISPLGRIILGYVVGIILLGLGMWLKKKYLNYSAVLVSGAMAIFYFITFFAYSYYELMSQEIAFGLMVIFTIFTVIAALNFDKQIIAHLGLVGAVAVPFLLSDDSGNALFLLSYIALINIGIAIISLKKNWKPLFYSAFVLTWMVYFTWLITSYNTDTYFSLAFGFLTLYFILFYIIFISYKLLHLKKYTIGDIIILLINSFIYFGMGYILLYEHQIGGEMLGVFALVNALIHFIAAYIIKKRKLADKNLFFLVIGLVIVCLTLAIPIQLEGYWITMMWSMEALILFYIGRSKGVSFYEYLSYALMIIAAISLAIDWEAKYYSPQAVKYYTQGIQDNFRIPILNTTFLTSLVSCICMGVILWIHQFKNWRSELKLNKTIITILDYVIPVAFIAVVYFSFRMEILHYFAQQYAESALDPIDGYSFASKTFKRSIHYTANIWLLNYLLLFFSLVSFYVYKRVLNTTPKWVLIGFNLLVIILSLASGLFELSELRENYLEGYQEEYYQLDNSFKWLRYLFIGMVAVLIICTFRLLKSTNKSYKIYAVAETVISLIVLWISSSELIHWLDFTEKSDTYGLLLSIYWGIFSVVIIAVGIWKKKKHLRILGIVLFAITLIKLFFYDLSHLTTIAKTIVMVSLGVLLLITSFLYNKYTIEDEEKM